MISVPPSPPLLLHFRVHLYPGKSSIFKTRVLARLRGTPSLAAVDDVDSAANQGTVVDSDAGHEHQRPGMARRDLGDLDAQDRADGPRCDVGPSQAVQLRGAEVDQGFPPMTAE